MHSAKSSPRPKVLESSSSDAKHAQRQRCLQHLQSQQKPAQRTGHRRSSRPETLDHGSTEAPHCPTETLLYPLPKCSYSHPTAQQHFPIPEAGSKESMLMSKPAQTTATQLRTWLPLSSPEENHGICNSNRQLCILQRKIPPARDCLHARGARSPLCPRQGAAKLHEELAHTSTGRGEPKTSDLP